MVRPSIPVKKQKSVHYDLLDCHKIIKIERSHTYSCQVRTTYAETLSGSMHESCPFQRQSRRETQSCNMQQQQHTKITTTNEKQQQLLQLE